MELMLCVFVLLAPLVGFLTPNVQGLDGWTIYRDRVLILFAFVLLSWLFVNEPAFGIIFLLLFLRFKGMDTVEGVYSLHGIALWSFILVLWLFVKHLSLEYLSLLLASLVLAGLVQCLLAIVDFGTFSYWRWKGKSLTPICGTLGNRTYLAAYLSILVPLVARRETVLIFLIFVIAILLCSSRGAVPALVAGVSVANWEFGKIMIPLGVIFVVLMLPWKHMDIFKSSSILDSFRGRLKVWAIAITATLEWPYILIGRGHNSFCQKAIFWMPQYGSKEGFVHAHNDYLQLFYEYGLAGVGALMVVFWQLSSSMYLGGSLTGSAVAIAVISLTTFPNHIAPIGATIVILLALISRGVLL